MGDGAFFPYLYLIKINCNLKCCLVWQYLFVLTSYCSAWKTLSHEDSLKKHVHNNYQAIMEDLELRG